MRDRRARFGFLALIFALPLVIGASTQAGPAWGAGPTPSLFRTGPTALASWSAAIPLAFQVELLIVAGLLYAGLQRRRLLACGIGAADRA